MSKIIKFLRVGAFVGFLWLPAICLPLLGAPPPYGRPFTPFPNALSVIATTEGRATLSMALVERTIFRALAIEAEDSVLYRGLGYIDTPLLVSGVADWLFYKQQFWNGQCLVPENISVALAAADVLQDVAEAADIRLVLSVSPDKVTVYPEKLNPRARAYWHCRQESGAVWRTLARQIAPRIIDHAEPILRARQIDPDGEFFFHTDTHWTPLGASLARRQLVAALIGGTVDELPLPRPRLQPGAYLERPTDMADSMLLLGLPERVPQIDPAPEQALAARSATIDYGATALVTNSFYAAYRDQFAALFPRAQFLTLDLPLPEAVLAASDTIIVNSVERVFFERLGSVLAWNETLARTIVKRNEARAQACDWRDSDRPPVVALGNLVPDPDGSWWVTGPDPQMPIWVPSGAAGARPCLSVTIDAAAPDFLEIFLPRRDSDPASPAFEAGRSIRVALVPGVQDIRLVLPDYAAGRQVRIDPVSVAAAAHVLRLSVGFLPAS